MRGMTIEIDAGESRVEALSALAQRTRDLMDAVVRTGVGEEELAAAADQLAAVTERLGAAVRSSRYSVDIAPDGTMRHLANAVIGVANPHALPLVVEVLAPGRVRAEVSFRPLHEGPPSGVHGGMTAMVLDHLLGQAVATAGLGGLTGTLTVRYRSLVPYGTPVVATAEYLRSEGRKSWAEGRVSLPDGTLLTEATGVFITPKGPWPNIAPADQQSDRHPDRQPDQRPDR